MYIIRWKRGCDSTRLRIPKAARLSRRFSMCGSARLGIFPARARIGNGARYGSSRLRIRRPSAARPSTVWVWLRGEYAWGDARTSDALSSAVRPLLPRPCQSKRPDALRPDPSRRRGSFRGRFPPSSLAIFDKTRYAHPLVCYPGESGGIGRRTGLRIQRISVGVQLPPLAPESLTVHS